MVHSLKIRKEYFDAIGQGDKNFEVRRYDRDFRVGDHLALNEINEDGEYTGRHLIVQITYIFGDEEFCKPGYVVLGIDGDLGNYNSYCGARLKPPDIPLVHIRTLKAKDTERRRIPVTEKQLEQMMEICTYSSCDKCVAKVLGCDWEEGRSSRSCLLQAFEIDVRPLGGMCNPAADKAAAGTNRED